RDPALLLPLGADAQDRRGDRRDREAHARRAGAVHLVDEDVLLDRRLPEPAEVLRPADAPPPLVEELLVEGARERAVALVAARPHLGAERRRDVLPDEPADLVPPGFLLRRVRVAHQSRTTRRKWTTSTRPVSPISTLMRNVKSESRSQPPKADQKPCTSKPRTTSEASFSIAAFTTRVNRPSVRMLSGSVRSSTSGRTTAFRIP